ncbi:energy-coupling factor ABC transporter ATP-binding protein [Rhodobacter sp. KR11]|uniref:energy-coupling factor ABC transporter ATP-binding protein n=1 Tax=Rhodobacter sp. KR11 TaxID=2974588 RepID=UPI002221D1A9|nr:energy-coupling factor ABC transporter ATP-binding protein [Rhodobacter sp. KR11]MCW1920041.1 energy-coupling factor ABC transporter ATP-binding protein [Rhodobacter sp. KR11]
MSGIHLNDVSLSLQGKPILTGIDLHLTEARIGLIGRNGSGKTSLLRLMAGLVAPTSGRVTVEGASPTDRKALLRSLGILFQNPDHQILFPTVIEELSFGLIQQGVPKAQAQARARDALTAEGRAHWEKAATHTLSQGQRQYLCLLALLLMAPRWLLLDEPFAALDLPTEARLRRRLDALPQRLITISHAPAAVERCDRVLWLEQGRIRADGPPAQVLPEFRAQMARIGEADADTDL